MSLIYRIFMCAMGTAVGAGTGMILSLVVMLMLTMISTEKFINIYYGVCFLLLGLMMLSKLYRRRKTVTIELGPPSG